IVGKAETLGRDSEPIEIHFSVAVLVLERLDGIDAGLEVFQDNNSFARICRNYSASAWLAVRAAPIRPVIKRYADVAAILRHALDLDRERRQIFRARC